REGVLLNPHTGRWYPIRDGIPTLFIDALREGDAPFVARYREAMTPLGCNIEAAPADSSPTQAADELARIESERRARDEQAEQYDRMISLKVYEYIETPTYRKALGEDFTTPLLEAGCGTGRFTGLFAELSKELVAVDMSRDSILRNRVRHAGKTAAPVHYVHADLTHLPLKSDSFGRTAHCGVYEHIPSRELRQQFLAHACRTLHSNGTLLLSAYRYGGITRFFGKEGEHDGGIPFTRFTEEELRDEVETDFEIEYFRPNLGIYMSMLLARPKA
ncbi:MAG: methyltransferase domain-containing protein, partial [Abitibacteriaceae bacterium]|nr:methyltransferase domain-containing protein [Abditibacteriaceae bacterium]